MKGRRWIVAAGKLALSGGLIAYLLTHISIYEVLAALKQAQPALVTAGMLMIPVFSYLRAGLMHLILARQGVAISAGRIMRINFSTAFYALFLPGLIAGGGIRWYLLSQDNKRYSEVLAAIVFNRLFNTITMLLIGIVFFFLDQSPLSNRHVGTGMLFCLVLLCLAYWAMFRSRLVTWIQNRLPRMRALPPTAVQTFSNLADAVVRFRDVSNRELVVFTAVSLAHHLFGVLSTYLISRALDLPLDLVTICWIRALLFFVLLMPISISGLGVREGSLVVALQAYGVGPASALGFSFLLLARDIVGGLTGGVIELVRFFRKPRDGKFPDVEKTVDPL